MRKLIWLALALGTVELVKREASKRGITPSALLSGIAATTAARLTGQSPEPEAKS
ncbi:MAG: hypothetical protein U1E93_04575 [Alphaproteobacteria bacterium]